MISTEKCECNNCLHNKVCSLKNDIYTVKKAAEEVFEKTNEVIEISIRCREFREEKLVRTPMLGGRFA